MQPKNWNLSLRKSARASLRETKPAIIPKGSIVVGTVGDRAVYLTPRDRSYGLLIIGAPGTGKTVLMERCARQDIDEGHGLIVIDPMGALVERLLKYLCYRKATGRQTAEVIPFFASDSDWVLPYNTFIRKDGELSVQVNRRVGATLRVWGQHSGDETPRLEKWLTALYFVLIECNLTIMEAGWLLDQHQPELRAFFAQRISNPLIRSKLELLSRYRTAEFLQQTESAESRLMRFLTSEHLSRIFGLGSNALDFRAIMDQGKILLMKVQPSKVLSPADGKLAGTLVLNEAFETALERESGARPCYCYVDEAAQYVSVEMAEALERLRQKGLHLTAAFQHAGQFKEEGVRLYKAFKNVRNKIVFAIPDRQDAMELADDLFVGLTEPKVKFLHRRLNHLVEDIRQTSTSRSHGTNASAGVSSSSARAESRSQGTGRGVTESSSQARDESWSSSRSRGSGWSRSTASTTVL